MPIRSCGRYSQSCSCLFHAETGKIPHFDQLSPKRILARQIPQSLIQDEQFLGIGLDNRLSHVKRNAALIAASYL